MEAEKNNKNKIYLVIIMFIMIMGLSTYVVVDRVIQNNNKKEDNFEKIEFKDNEKNIVEELSLNNKLVKQIYSYFNNEKLEYYLYLDKNKKLSWDSKSIIVTYNLDKDLDNVLNIDKEEFEKKYFEIFGDFSNNELRQSKKCPTTNYNMEDGIYTIDSYCYEDNDNTIYKTFFKNIILDKDDIVVNKYYVLLSYDKQDNTYSLYKNSDFKEKNLIASNIDCSDINNYINDMDIISYVFKKNNKNNYYFAFVK